MIYLWQLLLFVACICLDQYSVEATVFSCNATAPCGCSVNDVNINSRIVGGEPAASHSWGWSVSLRASNGRHFCGGTILSPYYILTAAHCVDHFDTTYFELNVTVGIDTLDDNNGQRIKVAQIYIHREWNTRTNENDIAILKLQNDIAFDDVNVAKLCLPPTNKSVATAFPMIRSSLVAIGWGHTTTGGIASSVLRQVTVQAVGNNESKCSNSIRNIQLQFCAAVDGGGKDTCQGDSGGPLMYYSPKLQQWMLAGITSYGRGCGLRDYAGIYTRVAVYIDWIKSIVGNDGVVAAGDIGTEFDESTSETTQISTSVAKTSTTTTRTNNGNMVNISNIFFITVFFSIYALL